MCNKCDALLGINREAFEVRCASCHATITVNLNAAPVPCPKCGGRSDIPMTPEAIAEAHVVAAEFMQRVHEIASLD